MNINGFLKRDWAQIARFTVGDEVSGWAGGGEKGGHTDITWASRGWRGLHNHKQAQLPICRALAQVTCLPKYMMESFFIVALGQEVTHTLILFFFLGKA
jgi:hypothetical protein